MTFSAWENAIQVRMFCPKCGNELIPGAAFCAACGHKLNFVPTGNVPEEQPFDETEPERMVEGDLDSSSGFETQEASTESVPEEYAADIDEYYQEEPAPKKSKKPLIIGICAAAAAAVVLICVFAGGALRGASADARILTASQKTMDAITKRSDVTAFIKEWKDADEKGVNVTAENVGGMLSAISPYLSYVNLDARFSAASDKKGNISAALDVDAFGSKIRAGYYAEEKAGSDLVIDIPAALEKPYGISFKTAAEDLDQSVFAPESNSDYALPKEQYDMVRNALESLGMIGRNASSMDLKELGVELFKNESTKIEFEKSKGETDAGDGNIRCDIYTAGLDEKKISSILDYTADWLEEKLGSDDGEGILSVLDSMGYEAGSVTETLKDMSEDIADSEVDLNLRFYVSNGYLVQAALDGKLSDYAADGKILFGSDPSKTNEVVLSLNMEETDFTLRLDLSEAEQNRFAADLYSKDRQTEVQILFEYNDAKQTFSFYTGEYPNLAITGGMMLEDGRMVLSDPSIDTGYYSMGLNGLSLELTKKPEIKTLKADYPNGYTNVLKLSEQEIESLATLISGLGSAFGNLFY